MSLPGRSGHFSLPTSMVRRYRMVAVLFAALALTGLAGFAALWALGPVDCSGTADGHREQEFTVKDTTVQPVHIVLSHTFPLIVYTEVSDPYFPDMHPVEVTDGVTTVHYNITITDEHGMKVKEASAFIGVEAVMELDPDDNSFTGKHPYDLVLAPGRYRLILDTGGRVDYRVSQVSAYQLPRDGLLILGVASSVLLGALVAAFLVQRRKFRRWSAPAPVDPELMVGQPGNEAICPACHRYIMRLPVDGVITCEHCGKRGRIG